MNDQDVPGIGQLAGQRPQGGLYDLPAVGAVFRSTREFFDQVAPQPGDPVPRVIAKQAFRCGAILTGSAAVAMVIL